MGLLYPHARKKLFCWKKCASCNIGHILQEGQAEEEEDEDDEEEENEKNDNEVNDMFGDEEGEVWPISMYVLDKLPPVGRNIKVPKDRFWCSQIIDNKKK